MLASAHLDLQQAAVAAAAVDYLSFLLGDALFAVKAASVSEIVKASSPMAVPMLPPRVLGVIRLRGAAVPVTDLAQRAGRGASALSKQSCIIVVDLGGDRMIGVLADAIDAVLTVGVEQLAVPSSLAGDPEFYAGMAAMSGQYEGRFAMLLNVQQVLSPEDIGAAIAALADCQTLGA